MKMLEYCKVILEKVSFDKILFEKELRKTRMVLHPNEIKDLALWVQENFAFKYPDVISNFQELLQKLL